MKFISRSLSFLMIITIPIVVKAQLSVSDSVDLFVKSRMQQQRIPALQLSIISNGKLVKTDSLLIKEMPINLGQLIGPEAPTSITNQSNSNGEAYRIEFKKDFKP